jgi:hypothetical protein
LSFFAVGQLCRQENSAVKSSIWKHYKELGSGRAADLPVATARYAVD